MIDLILLSLVLAILQCWVIPAVFNIDNIKWTTSNRDLKPDFSTFYMRSIRAWRNYQETFPLFLTLGILGVITNTDMVFLMQLWLAFRVVHLVTYMTSLNMLRTLSWLGSLVAIFMMGLALI